MTTFDGATSTHETPPPAGPDAAGGGPALEPDVAFDAFEVLRDQLDERDENDEDFADVTHVDIPGLGWRLVCSLDFPYERYQQWQKNALPKNQRNGRKTNPLDLNQATLSYLVLLNTCVGVEYRRNSGWAPLTEPDGSPCTLQSPTLLNRMGVVDPRLLARKLFKGDGRLIAGGQKVITDAGYTGESDAEAAEDPTE